MKIAQEIIRASIRQEEKRAAEAAKKKAIYNRAVGSMSTRAGGRISR